MPTARFRTTILLATALVILWSGVSCSTTTRYEVLSFLFDGVPDPNRSAEPVHPLLTVAEQLAERARRPAPTDALALHIHPPYQDRQCTHCHLKGATGSSRSWLRGQPGLIKPKRKLCLDCHDRPTENFIHGPVSAGDCSACHEHHNSRHEHLLKSRTSAELCVKCHTVDTFPTSKEHEEYQERDCTECHDPHAAARRFLLRDEKPDLRKPDEGSEPDPPSPKKKRKG
jgi:predicted CXXCH cytochrome family protein